MSFENTPFRDELESHKKVQYFEQIGGNTDFVVRKIHRISEEYKHDPKCKEIQQSNLEATKLFTELNDKYSIKTPVNFVLGKNSSNEEALVGITEFIDGVRVNSHISPDDKDFIDKLGNLHRHLIDYFDHKLRKNETILADITKPEQYIYGKRPKSTTKEIYLVDTGLEWTNYDRSRDIFGDNQGKDEHYKHAEYFEFHLINSLSILTREIKRSHEKYKNENLESLKKLQTLIDFLEESLLKARNSFEIKRNDGYDKMADRSIIEIRTNINYILKDMQQN